MYKTVTYEGEEIRVTFSTEGSINDYGIEHSPVWWEPTEIEVHSLYILNEPQNFETLSAKVQQSILSLADEFDSSEWE